MANDDDLELEDEPGDSPAIKQIRARNRQLAKEHREAIQRAETAEAAVAVANAATREIAFLKAGVNPEDPAARYFVKGYDGELTVEAIKAAAIEARILGGINQSHADTTADDLAAHQAITDAGRSGVSSGVPDGDYLSMLANAKSREEVIAIATRQDQRNRPLV